MVSQHAKQVDRFDLTSCKPIESACISIRSAKMPSCCHWCELRILTSSLTCLRCKDCHSRSFSSSFRTCSAHHGLQGMPCSTGACTVLHHQNTKVLRASFFLRSSCMLAHTSAHSQKHKHTYTLSRTPMHSCRHAHSASTFLLPPAANYSPLAGSTHSSLLRSGSRHMRRPWSLSYRGILGCGSVLRWYTG